MAEPKGIHWHVGFWLGIAEQNGWSESTPNITIWLDKEGRVEDSVGTRDGQGKLFVQEVDGKVRTLRVEDYVPKDDGE